MTSKYRGGIAIVPFAENIELAPDGYQRYPFIRDWDILIPSFPVFDDGDLITIEIDTVDLYGEKATPRPITTFPVELMPFLRYIRRETFERIVSSDFEIECIAISLLGYHAVCVEDKQFWATTHRGTLPVLLESISDIVSWECFGELSSAGEASNICHVARTALASFKGYPGDSELVRQRRMLYNKADAGVQFARKYLSRCEPPELVVDDTLTKQGVFLAILLEGPSLWSRWRLKKGLRNHEHERILRYTLHKLAYVIPA